MTSLYSGNLLDERNSRPIEGANLYVYTTAGVEAILTDATNQPLTQPIITDADGGFQYKAAEGVYRHDFWKNRTKIYTDERVIVGVPGSISVAVGAFGQSLVGTETATAARANLGFADATGAGYSGFSQAQPYTAGTVGKSLKFIARTTDAPYNAVADGATNDAAAVQAAITAQNLVTGGDVAVTGKSLVSTTLTITRQVDTTTSGLNITGVGNAATLVLPNAGFTLFTSANTSPTDPLNETLNFRNMNFVGSNPAAAAYVFTKDFLRSTFVNTRFEKVKAVNSPIYLQSLRFLNCEIWRHQGVWLNSGGVLFDCTFDNLRFEAGGSGIQCAGALGSRITNSLYEGSTGPFFKTDGGNGVLISGNYTEGNATKDYVLTDIAGLGASRGILFAANAMSITASGYNIDVGDVRGMASVGNYCTGDMFNMTNTRIGEFTSIGDHCAGTNKFSNDRFWEATADGLETLGGGLTATPAGGQATALVMKRPMNVITTAARSGAPNASVALPPSDDVINVSVGKYCHIINRSAQAIDVFYSQADRTNFGVPTTAIAIIQPGQARSFFSTGQGSWVPRLTLDTGWTAGTGTANKGAFAAYAGQTHTGSYVQATVQALDDATKNASQRLKAIEDVLRANGLING